MSLYRSSGFIFIDFSIKKRIAVKAPMPSEIKNHAGKALTGEARGIAFLVVIHF